MEEETINLDRGEVLAHLKHILGHDVEITEQQLTIFMHDLRKLIRKDQKDLLEKEQISDDCTCNCHETWHSRTSDNDTESIVESQSERKSIPPKPASSFIRPWNIRYSGKKAPSRNLKEDPVKLHQHYQNAWRQYRFPGESGHSDLRWNVREKMMGQGPTPRDDGPQLCHCPCCKTVPEIKLDCPVKKHKCCLKIEMTIRILE